MAGDLDWPMLHILIVDDSATMRAGLGKMIERMGHLVSLAEGGQNAVDRFTAIRPDMILLDVLMDDMDGYSVARQLRTLPDSQWVPIIFLSAKEEDQDLERGIEAGGDDYLVKPVSYVVLNAKIRAMQRINDMRRKLLRLTDQLAVANRELERLTHHDGLTGIANRRYLDNFLTQELERARRKNSPLALLLCDVDHFKAYNDHYGHLTGDECLKQVAAALSSVCTRSTDLAARYGGEEFALVLPEADARAALAAAQRLQGAVAGLGIPHAQSQTADVVTISVGAHSCIPGMNTLAGDLLMRVDEALYQAKQLGRNRCVAWPSPNVDV